MARAKHPTYTTPLGIAKFPHLNAPDTRFNPNGDYKVDLRVKAEDAADLITYLEGIRDEFAETVERKKGVKYFTTPVAEEEVDDEGEETGYVIFKTKLNAKGENKKTGETWTNTPKLFDSQGNPMSNDTKVWSGSKLIVAGTVSTYAMTSEAIDEKTGKTKKIVRIGVSLKCRGVQVIELVSGGGQTADSFGFGAVEGGYTTDAAQAGFGNTDSSGDAEDDDDGEDDEEF